MNSTYNLIKKYMNEIQNGKTRKSFEKKFKYL